MISSECDEAFIRRQVDLIEKPPIIGGFLAGAEGQSVTAPQKHCRTASLGAVAVLCVSSPRSPPMGKNI